MRARARPRRLGFAPAGARLSPCRKLCRRKRPASNTRPSIPSRPNSILLHHLGGPRAGPAGREAADPEHRAGPLLAGWLAAGQQWSSGRGAIAARRTTVRAGTVTYSVDPDG